MKRFRQNTIEQIKERTRNIITIDNNSMIMDVMQDPLQPYMTFLLDTIALILSHDSSKDSVTIQNKDGSFRFEAENTNESAIARAEYRLILYRNDAVCFSARAINGTIKGSNNWFFTDKYKDFISMEDVDQFIEAAAVLSTNHIFSQDAVFSDLVQWTILNHHPLNGTVEHKYDDSAVLIIKAVDNAEYYECEFWMKDILVAICNANEFESSKVTFEHEIPDYVIKKLADTVRKNAKHKYKQLLLEKVKNKQAEFYKSVDGIKCEESAMLNGMYKQYEQIEA